jgi:hypothetical protein
MPNPEKDAALAPAELQDLRARLARARGRARLDLVLDARDPQALVRALPADEVYFTIREVGLADAGDLVPLASAEQFKVFLDLDAWKGDAFDPKRALPWLRAARSGHGLDPRAAARWARKVKALDAEVLFLVLRDAVKIHDLDHDPDPEFEGDRFMRTPEGRFIVEFTVDGADYVAVRGLVDDLYAEAPLEATRLLANLRWETRTELEEEALRWRQGRLADLGYPPLDEALSWFARPPKAPPAAPAGPPPARAPGFFLAGLRRGTLLDRAAARLGAEEAEALEGELVAAGNAVLVADAVDVGDPDAVREAFEGARGYLELGLELLSRGDGAPTDVEARAAAALAATPLKRIFQEGSGRVLALAWRAERLLASGGGTRAEPLLDAPLGEAVAALAARRPRYHPGLDLPRGQWGEEASAAYEPRRFATSEELRRAAEALDLAEGLVGLAVRLGIAPEPRAPAGPRLSARWLTAIANERLGRGFSLAPIAPEDLGAAAEAARGPEDSRLVEAGEAGRFLAELCRRKLGGLGENPGRP